ncbi:hypothetical protein PaG_05770 [Moesziomyces aphidis]|uniref:BAG domain-containing protein n=1 Tax=Moesziomyces aphidis TaxID=84754 RepID=W3VFG2_MOEAP|nr:hypothetical protein PaG_05770 [Moesziomyces aphidis]
MSSQTEWPQSLKDFANRAFAACNDANRKAVSDELRALIFDSFQNGTIHTTDWANASLKSLAGPSVAKKSLKKRVAPPSTPATAADPDEQARKEKRARRFEREQAQFQHEENQANLQSTSLASRFGSAHAQNGLAKQHGVDVDVADPNVIDWDEHTVVGTSTKLEKPYLRLTSAPDPKTVRPLSTLVQTLELLKKKWRTENNYGYICDQFKSMRQDLTVQRIKNEFTVKVYEIHARIALEMADLGEYNQCQSQLRGLYAHGIRGSAMEFLAYRILYLLHTKNRRDVNALMAELTEEHKEEVAVKHALDVRKALVTGNYHAFFALYADAPNMNAYVMDHFVERERINALLVMSKCYRPGVALSFIADELAFQDVAEADAFLAANNAAAYIEPTPAEIAALAPAGKKKKARPAVPLDKRQWDAKAAMQPLADAMLKFRKVDSHNDRHHKLATDRTAREHVKHLQLATTMSWFSTQWNRFAAGGSAPRSSDVIRRIEVVWGRERLQIVLPRTSEPVTLGHLRQEIASITALPYEKIKLIHRGLIMRDDRLPLTAYGLVEGSRIGLVGSREGDRPGAKTSQLSVGEQKAREKKAKEQDTSESGLMNRITEALDSAKLLFPEVEQLEAKVEREGKAEGVEDTHRRVSELLLRQLLALDSVAVNSDTTRQARKVAVKQVQQHLDRLDAAWSKFKAKPAV